jgi:HEAT repeat protein
VQTQALLLPMLAAFGLLAGLAGLVLTKRLSRSRAERHSQRRRRRWLDALGPGSPADVRVAELRTLARGAWRSMAAQDDLLKMLAHRDLPPRDARGWLFLRALERGGLGRALFKALGARRAMVRGRAALLAARLGLPGTDEAVGPLMADRDPDVRAAATQALATCATERAAEALLDGLLRELVEPERVVERLTGSFAVRPLMCALHRPQLEGRRPWLAEALGLTGDPRAEAPLVTLLRSDSEEERIRACRGLGRLGLASSCDAILSALEDPSPAVRTQAARALGALSDQRALPLLVAHLSDSSWWVRARSAEALVALGDAGLAALRSAAIDNPDRFARERAAEALAR